MAFANKFFWIGKPLASAQLHEQRLRKLKALPILSSDALSSVAYGTEEILRVLMLAGAAALGFSLHISLAICALLALLGASYWQTIHAYPNGGGAFTVAKENLGRTPGLLAAAALLIDYLMTVAVSISAGVLAITSAFPSLLPSTVLLGVFAIIFIAWMNLRGVRESASIFALPTYAFILLILSLILLGIWKHWNGALHPQLPIAHLADTQQLVPISSLLILRAFSQGCSALTGIECIANGVPAFEKPEVTNAGYTLLMMVSLLGAMFLGISYLANELQLVPLPNESLLSCLARAVFGDGSLYYAIQAATALILLLAANTAFTGFPRLASILSEQQFLPKQLSTLGDRLSFSNGIMLLAILSCALVILFHGDTNALIPLYSVGVFLAFSLSQLGMVRCWFKQRHPGWYLKAAINLLGFLATAMALLVIIESKFTEGAWIIMLLIPILLLIFNGINKHYCRVEQELAVAPAEAQAYFKTMAGIRPKVIVPVSKLHRGTLAAIHFARTLAPDVVAVAVAVDEPQTIKLQQAWEQLHLPIPLTVINSPYRATVGPLVEFITQQDKREPERGLCMLVLPEAVPTRWWHYLLHNQRATLLKAALYYKRRHKGKTRIFVDVPYQLKRG